MTLGLRIGRLLLLGILLAPPAHGAVEKVCVDWFAQKKLKAGSPDCVLGCSSASVDLGTFSCPNRCDDLCRPTDSCPSYRRKLDRTVTDSSPRKWEQATEKRKTWTKSERIAVLNALLKLPETLVEKSSFEIHRMAISNFKGNPASTLGKDIVLYDRALNATTDLARVLAHELAHIYWNSLTPAHQKDYQVAANWLLGRGNEAIPGRDAKTFVEPDGTNSPDEDFANNLEYLLFDSEKLRTLTPSLIGWLRSFLGDKFILGGRCDLSRTNREKRD